MRRGPELKATTRSTINSSTAKPSDILKYLGARKSGLGRLASLQGEKLVSDGQTNMIYPIETT